MYTIKKKETLDSFLGNLATRAKGMHLTIRITYTSTIYRIREITLNS